MNHDETVAHGDGHRQQKTTMETSLFDRLARSRNRRTTLRAVALALLGAGGTTRLGEQATSAKRKKGRHGHNKHRHGRGGTNNSGDNGGGFPGQGTCAGGADACLGVGSPICTCGHGGHTGLCRSQMEGGTVCAIDITSPAQTACDQCKTNGDCIALGFPPGSSCVVDSGPNCRACLDNTLGTCVAPCGFQEPA
jgi:hypothetical protein